MIHLISALMISLVFRKSNLFPVPVTQVSADYGKTVEILCTSNDKHHSFYFWQINNQYYSIIGPGKPYDRSKYEYEVLSGKLIIKGVTEDEEGVYNCVSRGVRNDTINIRPVTLTVKTDEQIIYEESPAVNFFRGVIIVGTVAIFVGGAFLAYTYFSPEPENPRSGPSDDDDSDERLFESSEPSTSASSQIIYLHDRFHANEGFDNTGQSTDFGSFLKNSAKE